MKRVYTANTAAEVELIKGLLEEAGMRVIAQAEDLVGALGMIPMDASALPSLWVDEANAARALEIINDHHDPEGTGLGEAVPPQEASDAEDASAADDEEPSA